MSSARATTSTGSARQRVSERNSRRHGDSKSKDDLSEKGGGSRKGEVSISARNPLTTEEDMKLIPEDSDMFKKDDGGSSVEVSPYYHGALGRDQIEAILKKKGDFALRMSAQGGKKGKVQMQMVLTVHVDNSGVKFRHLPVDFQCEKARTKCRIGGTRVFFENMEKLIAHYTTAPLPGGGFCGKAVNRAEWFKLRDNVKICKKLGAGEYADVFKGKQRDQTGRWEDCAVKKARTKQVDEAHTSLMMKEATTMSKYDHPNIVRLYGVILNTPPVVIVLEFCEGGALIDYLKKHKALTVQERVRMCKEAAAGLHYLCDEKKVVHRDVAARNCLLDSKLRVKISDFGLSICPEQAKGATNSGKMPIRYMAPETLKKHPKFTAASDVYSYGTLTWEIFTGGKQPWAELKTNKEVAHQVRKGDTLTPPDNMPPKMQRLAKDCWALSSDKRPTFKAIHKRLLAISDTLGARAAAQSPATDTKSKSKTKVKEQPVPKQSKLTPTRPATPKVSTAPTCPKATSRVPSSKNPFDTCSYEEDNTQTE